MERIIKIFKNFHTGLMAVDKIAEDGINWQSAIFIKEHSTVIKEYEHDPEINIRAGVHSSKGVSLFNIIVKVGNEVYYESFLDYFSDGESDVLNGLASQNELSVIFLNEDTNIAKIVIVKNQLKDEMKRLVDEVSDTVPWTTEQYDVVRGNFLAQSSNIMDLWIEYSSVSDCHKLKNLVNFESIWNGYLTYKQLVIQAAPEILSLRDKDRYLWGKSYTKQLENDISKMFK